MENTIKTEALEIAEGLLDDWQSDSFAFFTYLLNRHDCSEEAPQKRSFTIDRWLDFAGCIFEENADYLNSALANEFKANLLVFANINQEHVYLSRLNSLLERTSEALRESINWDKHLRDASINLGLKLDPLEADDLKTKKMLDKAIQIIAFSFDEVLLLAPTSIVLSQYPEKFKYLHINLGNRPSSESASIPKDRPDSPSSKTIATKDQILLLSELGVFDLPSIKNLTAENRGKLFARLLNRNEKNVTEYIRNCNPNGNKQAEDNPYIYENKVASIEQLLKEVGFIKK